MAKTVLITGNGLRHRYAVKALSEYLDLYGVVFEKKAKITTEPESNLAADETEIIRKHFSRRDQAEKKYFGTSVEISPGLNTLEADHGHSNSEEVFEWVKSQKPDLLILYGSSIIKAPLLDYYKNRIVNMHLGLSPYYRGSGTNFWPLAEGKPECVGATIHLATQKVDAGSILSQVRPDSLKPDDNAHDMGTKTIIAGLKKMGEIIPGYLNEEIRLHKQDLSAGKVFRRKDFNAGAVLKMWEHLENGMISDYLKNKENRDKNYPIIEQ
jgi:folate-dependent phosphoribosylglycinamide formyltransferase PurN